MLIDKNFANRKEILLIDKNIAVRQNIAFMQDVFYTQKTSNMDAFFGKVTFFLEKVTVFGKSYFFLKKDTFFGKSYFLWKK